MGPTDGRRVEEVDECLVTVDEDARFPEAVVVRKREEYGEKVKLCS